MKKITLFIVALAFFCASLLSAQSRDELILKGTMGGLSYKKARQYAVWTLREKPELKEPSSEGLTEKEYKKVLSQFKKTSRREAKIEKKLSKYESKIQKGNAKFEALKEQNPEKAEKKQDKITKKTKENNARFDAIDAYQNFIYKGEKDEDIPINPKTGFPEILNKPFVTFDEGVAYDMITRLQKQDKYDRSDFVWQDHLIGAYFGLQTVNMKPCDSVLQISAFYPFYHTFNGMEQFAKQTILYAFDFYAGPNFQADMWKYVRLNFSFGPHYMYQLSDEYHLNYLGGGVVLGLELPVARRWTVVTDGRFTLDYANLGTNQKIQPFDYSWSYGINVGVRYSKRNLNRYAYIHKRFNSSENTEQTNK